MARYAVNGLDVFVEEVNPQGTKTLVLLHGFTGSTKTWQHVVQALPTTVRCIMVDLIGHGETSAPEDIEAYAMDFQASIAWSISTVTCAKIYIARLFHGRTCGAKLCSEAPAKSRAFTIRKCPHRDYSTYKSARHANKRMIN